MELIKRAHTPLTKKRGARNFLEFHFSALRFSVLKRLFHVLHNTPTGGSAAIPPKANALGKGTEEFPLRPSKSLSFPAPPPPSPRNRPPTQPTTLMPNCSSPLEEIQFAGTLVADVHKESSLFQDPSLPTAYTHTGFHHPRPPHPGGFTVMEPCVYTH